MFATVTWARAPTQELGVHMLCRCATAEGWADLGCGLQEGFEKVE